MKGFVQRLEELRRRKDFKSMMTNERHEFIFLFFFFIQKSKCSLMMHDAEMYQSLAFAGIFTTETTLARSVVFVVNMIICKFPCRTYVRYLGCRTLRDPTDVSHPKRDLHVKRICSNDSYLEGKQR